MAKGKRTTIPFDPEKIKAALEEAIKTKSYKNTKKSELLLPFKDLIQQLATDGATAAKIAAVLKSSGGFDGSSVTVNEFIAAHIKMPEPKAATAKKTATAPAPAPAMTPKK